MREVYHGARGEEHAQLDGFSPGGFHSTAWSICSETLRHRSCSGTKGGFPFAPVEHLQAFEWQPLRIRVRQFSEFRCYRPVFGQLYGHRRDRLFESLQVATSGSRIDAAEDSTCLLHILRTVNLSGRLGEMVEPDDTVRDEEVRQQPLRVRSSGRVSLRAIDRDNENAPVLSGLRVPVAAIGIGVHVQAMNLATQRTRLVFISEVALL